MKIKYKMIFTEESDTRITTMTFKGKAAISDDTSPDSYIYLTLVPEKMNSCVAVGMYNFRLTSMTIKVK